MAASFRLTAHLPSDPTEHTKVRAEAFSLALHEAATSPEFRIEIIVGEAYAKYSEVVDWLMGEIEKEPVAVQEAFIKATETVPKSRYDNVTAVHALLMVDAATRSILTQTPSCPKITATGSTDS